MFNRFMKNLIVTGMILGLLFGGSFAPWGGSLLSANVEACTGDYTVTGTTYYLALRTRPCYDDRNEIGKLYNGESVTVVDYGNGTYWYVYSPKLKMNGYVNKNYLYASGAITSIPSRGCAYRVTGTTYYLALRSAPSYNSSNEIGKLYNGEYVYAQNCSGTYWYVYSEKLGISGYVNSNYLV